MRRSEIRDPEHREMEWDSTDSLTQSPNCSICIIEKTMNMDEYIVRETMCTLLPPSSSPRPAWGWLAAPPAPPGRGGLLIPGRGRGGSVDREKRHVITINPKTYVYFKMT